MIQTASPSGRRAALEVSQLRGGPGGADVLKGVSFAVSPGEVVAIMGPNGSGKSTLVHLLMGRPGFEITGGGAWVDGIEITCLPTFERSRAGLFAAFQYPTELPGIRLEDVVRDALNARGDEAVEVGERVERAAQLVGMDPALLVRGVNDDFSGGEKKRSEIVQMDLLSPKAAVLDEIDSGLDVDALAAVAARVRNMVADGAGVLLITHYKLLLEHVEPTTVHILVDGQIERSGGPQLAAELEIAGYATGA